MYISLLLLANIFLIKCQSIDDGIIVKCCPEDKGLHRSEVSDIGYTYECVSLEHRDESVDLNILQPLRVGKNNTMFINRFPENCTHTETALSEGIPEKYCIDKLFSITNSSQAMISGNGSVVVIKCVDDPPINVLSLRTVSKCCKKGMVYDVDRHVCTRNNGESKNLFENYISEETSLLDVKYGISNTCTYPRIVYEYTDKDSVFELTDDVLTLINSNKTFVLEPGSFCLDDAKHNGLIAKACRDECDAGPCIKKCCPEGQIYISTNQTGPECLLSDAGLPFSLYAIKGKERVLTQAKGAIGITNNMVCPNNRYLETRQNFLDIASGNIYIPDLGESYQILYCIEMFENRSIDPPVPTLYTFVCFPDHTEATKNDRKYKMYSYGLIVSCIFLAATLIVYIALPQLRNLHGKTIMCHVFAMLIAYSTLAKIGWGDIHPVVCRSLGFIIYFAFLSAFAWLNIMCFDIWWTFGNIRTVQGMKKNKDLKRFLMFSLYAWGLPTVFTLATYLFDEYNTPMWLDAEMGLTQCWFSSDTNKLPWLILFIIPVGIIIGSNFVLFVLTALYCNKIKSEIHRMQAGSMGERCKRRFLSDKAKYAMNIKLFIVMGISWILEIISYIVTEPIEVWYITDAINVLQGVSIFCILILKRKVYLLIKKRLGIARTDPHTSNATVSTNIGNSTDDKVSTAFTGLLKPTKEKCMNTTKIN